MPFTYRSSTVAEREAIVVCLARHLRGLRNLNATMMLAVRSSVRSPRSRSCWKPSALRHDRSTLCSADRPGCGASRYYLFTPPIPGRRLAEPDPAPVVPPAGTALPAAFARRRLAGISLEAVSHSVRADPSAACAVNPQEGDACVDSWRRAAVGLVAGLTSTGDREHDLPPVPGFGYRLRRPRRSADDTAGTNVIAAPRHRPSSSSCQSSCLR